MLVAIGRCQLRSCRDRCQLKVSRKKKKSTTRLNQGKRHQSFLLICNTSYQTLKTKLSGMRGIPTDFLTEPHFKGNAGIHYRPHHCLQEKEMLIVVELQLMFSVWARFKRTSCELRLDVQCAVPQGVCLPNLGLQASGPRGLPTEFLINEDC